VKEYLEEGLHSMLLVVDSVVAVVEDSTRIDSTQSDSVEENCFVGIVVAVVVDSMLGSGKPIDLVVAAAEDSTLPAAAAAVDSMCLVGVVAGSNCFAIVEDRQYCSTVDSTTCFNE